MDDLSARLSTSIMTLVAHFKTRPDGPYAGLSLVETSIVASIAAATNPPLQGEVGSALRLPKTTMTSAVGRLESKGLIERVASVVDGRVRVLMLTTAGKDLADSLASAQMQSSKTMLEALPPDDRIILVQLLERIADDIQQQS